MHTRRPALSRRLALLAIAVAVAAAAQPAITSPAHAFTEGDLYVANNFDGTPPTCTIGGAITRIDPVTFARTAIYQDTNGTALPNLNAYISYDPVRDRIVFYEEAVASGIDFSLIDETGTVTALPDPTNIRFSGNSGGTSPAHMVRTTSARDGRIFLMGRDYDNSSEFRFQYWDAGDNLTDLLDQAGTAPFIHTLAGSAFGLYAIHYHAGTNALFVTEARGAPDLDTVILKIPLSADGTRVASAPTTIAVEVSTTSQDRATQWSEAPGGQLMLNVDTNTASVEPRLLLVDPVTLATQTWATTTSPGQTSGFYDPGRDAAVTRTLNDIREYEQGDPTGTTLTTGAFCQSGTNPHLILITSASSAVPLLGPGGVALLMTALGAAGMWAEAKRRGAARTQHDRDEGRCA